MTKPRDNQKQRLYDAEGVTSAHRSKAAERYLSNGKKVESTGSVSIEACQSYVDHVVTSAWFQSRWGRRRPAVRHKVSGNATYSSNGYISVPPWSRNEWSLLHEIAHSLVSDFYADHGPEFAGVLLTLVRYQCGPEAAKTLRESYRKHRVRYSMVAVPKPSKPVTPRTSIEKAEKARARRIAEAAKAREEREAQIQQRQLVGYTGRQRAAASIRANVRAGLFGPSGSKPRTHALATARALEKGRS